MKNSPTSDYTPEMFYQEIQAVLKANANPSKAKGMRAYMKDKFSYFGLTSPIRRSNTKDLVNKSKSLTTDSLWSLTHLLWTAEQREYQYVAMDIWAKNLKKIEVDAINHIERLITHKSWWDSVDWLASHMVGGYNGHFPALLINRSEEWVTSNNIWLNRTCLLYQLSYKKETDYNRLSYYIEHLKSKKEFFIQKAIGWSLRQYSRTDKEAVIEAVERFELEGLARREALKLITTGKV